MQNYQYPVFRTGYEQTPRARLLRHSSRASPPKKFEGAILREFLLPDSAFALLDSYSVILFAPSASEGHFGS